MKKHALGISLFLWTFSASEVTYQLSSSTRLRIIVQNITSLHNIDALVNAANQTLSAGGGVCGAIFKVAGYKKLELECNNYPLINGIRCPTGQARITNSYDLKEQGIKYIIHAVGPHYSIANRQETLLEDAYLNSLIIANNYQIKSIAFPLISAGIYGFPKEFALRIALTAFQKYTRKHPAPELIIMCLFSQEEFDAATSIATDLFKSLCAPAGV